MKLKSSIIFIETLKRLLEVSGHEFKVKLPLMILCFPSYTEFPECRCKACGELNLAKLVALPNVLEEQVEERS